MTLLGLDFDNTLVRYDKLFHQLALEKGLIKKSLPADKTAIRDYLRSQGQDEQFTLMQGEVYGLRILEAEPAEGMLKALSDLHQRGIPMVLVSHKTRTPYKGHAYDLHQAAWSWLEKYGFFAPNGLGWSKNQVFFEETKQEKINRIVLQGCSHFVDDLPEILGMIPEGIQRILYASEKKSNKEKLLNANLIHLENWIELTSLIK
jgi:FMN phosphatase YigB (HAD superfamily)